MANNVNVPAFTPCGATVNISASNSSGNVQVRSANGSSRHCRFFNAGTVTVFVEFGETNSVVATTSASMPIAAGSTEVISCRFPYVAAITAASTATLYITPGEGL